MAQEIYIPTIAEAREYCAKEGHMPTLTIADNGFTYEHVCARCGKKLRR